MQSILPVFAWLALLEPEPILALDIPRHANIMLTIGIQQNTRLNMPNVSNIVAAFVLSTVCTGIGCGFGIPCAPCGFCIPCGTGTGC